MTAARSLRSVLACALVLGALRAIVGCSGDDSHPAELSPTPDGAATTKPRSCGEVRGGTPDGVEIAVDGEIAECGAEGLECVLSDLATFATVCDAGAPYARCGATLRWWILCDLDGGLGLPGADASQDADDDAPQDADDGAPQDAGSD